MFLGASPTLGLFAFDLTDPGFSIYFFSDRTGFTLPTWNGYPAVRVDRDRFPAAVWLLQHGLPFDHDLDSYHNADGVTTLVALALDLDTSENLRGRMPTPIVDPGS